LLAACGKTLVRVNYGPTSKKPEISWFVINLSNVSTIIRGSGSVTVPRGPVQVNVLAHSPSGVKSLSVSPLVANQYCKPMDRENDHKHLTIYYHRPTPQTQIPNAEKLVDSNLILFDKLDFSRLVCPKRYEYQSGLMDITATAKNFGGKTTVETLRLKIK